MGINFRIKDFAYPIAILKLRRQFEDNQWRSEEYLSGYQFNKLKNVLNHAYNNVRYYKDLFRQCDISPNEIKSLSDLNKIPVLTKDILRDNFASLSSSGIRRFKPVIQHTSGTTGKQIDFYADKGSNVLEFVYYWRFWGWAGYRLGDTFAELSAESFMPFETYKRCFYRYNRMSGRLLLNSLLISQDNLEKYIVLFNRLRPKFLKGLASGLYVLAALCRDRKNSSFRFNAIFSQGENLLKHQRELISKVFSCEVYDSYGHMERTAAISQCRFGTYHVHPDYGIVEFKRVDAPAIDHGDGPYYLAEVIGTSLYNYAMPLLRYRTGDFVRIPSRPEKCPCGRNFQSVASVEGRSVDVIITRDRRALTAVYTVIDRTPGIDLIQIVQVSIGKLVVRMAVSPAFDKRIVETTLIRNLRDFTGPDMEIEVSHEPLEKIKRNAKGKFKVILSELKQNTE